METLNRFYTYAYLREDGTPYYVGKGKIDRAYYKCKNEIKTPKDKSRIIFLKQNLTEEEAFKHEIYMIAVLGRKDLGTGILRNRTSGGEGASGAIRSEELKEKLRNANIGKNNPRYGKKHSEETKIKIGKKARGRKHSKETREKQSEIKRGKNHPCYGKKRSKETKEKISSAQKGEKHHSSNWWKIVFLDGTVIERCGIKTWAKENGYHSGALYALSLGKSKRHKDIVSVEKLAFPSLQKVVSIV